MWLVGERRRGLHGVVVFGCSRDAGEAGVGASVAGEGTLYQQETSECSQRCK